MVRETGMFIEKRLAAKQTATVAITLCGLYSQCFAQVTTAPSDLSVTSVRKAMAAEHAAIAAHPKDPTNYVNLAYTLTDAGMGEQARLAVANATRVAPTNSFAFSAQAWVLHHNTIGVDYGNGFDYDGSLASYRKAIELDPKDLDARQSLANLLEYGRDGVRYAPTAQLSLAIDAYRYIQQHQRPLHQDVVNNLAIDLFYAGRYEEAIKELSGLPGTPENLGVILASTAALQGSPTAITLSNRIEGDEQRRKDALTFAAEGLWNRRFYTQAADLLTASLPNPKDGPEISAKIQIFRNLKPFETSDLPVSDPRRPVQRLMELIFTGSLQMSSFKDVVSSHAYSTDAAWVDALQQANTLAGTILALMIQTGLPRAVVADIVLGRMSVAASTDPQQGTPIRLQVVGLPAMQFFVVQEDGTWKVASSGLNPSEVGSQALYLLANGRPQTAVSLLNWFYSLQKRPVDGKDPLTADVFLRVWSPAMRPEVNAPLFAGAALAEDDTLLRPLVPRIVEAGKKASSDDDQRDNLDVLLATAYLRLLDAPNARAVTSQLLSRYPQSNAAFRLRGQSYALDRDWDSWKALLVKRLQADPDNRQLLIQRATEAVAEGDYEAAAPAYERILDSSQVTPADYTAYAWLSLLNQKPSERAFAAAQQLVTNRSSHNYQSLLAVACLSAIQGDTAEAHQGLLDAMSSAHLVQPDAGIWYGFGLIFEQYSVADAAKSAYQRAVQMSAPSDPFNLPQGVAISTLAEIRLKGLSARYDISYPARPKP